MLPSILLVTGLLLALMLQKLSGSSISMFLPQLQLRRMSLKTNMVDGQITPREIGSGMIFGFVNFIAGLVFLFVIGPAYVPSNGISNTIGAWGFIAFTSFVLAILAVIVLGYLTENMIGSVFLELGVWTVLGLILFAGNIIGLNYLIIGYISVGLSAAVAHYVDNM